MKVIAKKRHCGSSEIGAEISHDFMLDGDDFTDVYKERSFSNG